MTCHGVPDENVPCLLMPGEMPTGEVVHHPVYLAGTWVGRRRAYRRLGGGAGAAAMSGRPAA